MTCFDKVLSSEWHKVARCIQGMVSKGKGMLTSAFYWNKYCQNLIKRRIIKWNSNSSVRVHSISFFPYRGQWSGGIFKLKATTNRPNVYSEVFLETT